MEQNKNSTKSFLLCLKNSDYKPNALPSNIKHRKYKLLPQFDNEINEYLRSCKDAYSNSQLRNIKARCTKFMWFIQNRGLTDISMLVYDDIQAYHTDDPYKKRINRMLYESSTKLFLFYLADKGRCRYGLGRFLHYLQNGRIVAPDDVASISCEFPYTDGKKPLMISVEEYRNLFEDLISTLKAERLCKEIIEVYENAFRLHYIFMDMNGFDYSLTRAIAWAEAAKNVFKSSWPTVRRAMRLFDDFARTGFVVPGKTYSSRTRGFDCLPEWCKFPIAEFVKQRERTKMSPSTTEMDMISCARFCEYLSKTGLVSFQDLTATAIKDFNIQDKHQTSGGKGAYNSRIRGFLKFLAREGYVANALLYQALGGPAASSEKIVITLSEAEKESLKSFNTFATLELEQRDKAYILLGTEMGIRGCDIVNLRFGDINWKDRSIRFKQEKTEAEVWLPMPVSVGNAIYRYIKDGRPKEVKCDHIFVTTKAPYRKLSPPSCGQTMRRAIPDRKVEGSGFHVTRKTFATERLRNNVDPDQIANAMGHATRGSLTPYLSLDDERMGLCPLSIEDLDLLMRGGFGDE